MKKEIILLTLMLLFASYSFADIIHVPEDQPTIQAAIDIAENDDIVLVDDGIYVENINFYGKVITVGSLYLTTGDISHITQTIIDGSANGSVVTFNNDEETGSVLIGFTIMNGNAENGGGIYISDGSEPTLSNLFVFGNTATDGGGIFICDSSPEIEELIIFGNNVINNGGGIFISEESEPNLIMTVIENNNAFNNGGGIYLCDDSALNSIYVRISANIALNGGGIYCDSISEDMGHIIINENTATMHGGGLYFLDSGPDVINLTVFGNTATDGGGIYSGSSNPVLTDCILWNDNPQEIVGSATVSYSDIQEGWPGVGILEIVPNFTPSSNFHLDPFNTAGDNKNPLIDAGAPGSDYEEEPEPNGSRINMGAYGNTEEATISINIPPANIVGNVTWTNDYLYLLRLDLTVNDDAFLTIETGTKIEVEEGNVIYVNGRIDASAIAGDSILISPDTGCLDRNNRDEPWGGLIFDNVASDNSVLNNVVMENAINGIELNGVDVEIINTKILFYPATGVTSGIGIILNDNSNTIINNCDIEGYQTGIDINNSLPQNASTPTVTNTRVRNSPESSREEEIGINISGNVVAYIDSCDIVGCPYGIKYVGTATATTSTPTVTNTRVRNSPESSRTSLISGIYIDSLFNIEILNCDIEYCQTGIEIVNNSQETSSTPTVTNTRVRNSPESSRDVFVGIKVNGNIEGIVAENEMAFCDTAIIILGDLANPDINHNLIYLDGIPTMSDVAIFAIGSDNLSISNNTIYDYLIGFVSESTVTHFFNNIIWYSSPIENPIQESSSTLTIEYNDIIMAAGIYPGTGNINEDPLFVDPLQVDFHLQADSPCIDAGDPASPLDPDGSIADMGAYYFHQFYVPPYADFTADIINGYAPLTVNFTDLSMQGTEVIDEWYWDFGDGNNSSLQNPSNEYYYRGTYTVSLMVTDVYELTDTEIKVDYISVLNSAPVVQNPIADFSFDEDTSDSSIDLNNIFNDADIPYGDVLSFSYSGNSNIAVEITNGIVTLTPNPDWFGFEDITFTATDDSLESASDEVRVTIDNVNDDPLINFYFPAYSPVTINETESQLFWVSASDIDGDPLSYQWYLDDVTQTGQTDSTYIHTTDYTSAGTYMIKCIVDDCVSEIVVGFSEVSELDKVDQFSLDSESRATDYLEWQLIVNDVDQEIMVNDIQPAPGPVTIDEMETINFFIDAYDPDGNPLEYSWKLDGVEVSITSTYDFITNMGSAGLYLVTLDVTDNFGTRRISSDVSRNTLSYFWEVMVIDVDQEIVVNDIQPLPGSITINETESIEFYIDAYDPDENTLEYSWELDGVEVSTDCTYLFETDYTSAGEYVVTLEVTDNFGTCRISGSVSRNTLNYSWDVNVNDVDQPVVVNELIPPEGNIIIDEGDVINFSIDAYDPDGNELEYSWQVDGEEVSTTNSFDFITDENSAGEYETTLYITDNFGTRDELNFLWNVTVNDVVGIEGYLITTISKLHQNHPNPFNPTTNIRFSIEEVGPVQIDIFNVKGQFVRTLIDKEMEAGNYHIIWNGKDSTGKSVSSGTYFYKMKTNTFSEIRKATLLK